MITGLMFAGSDVTRVRVNEDLYGEIPYKDETFRRIWPSDNELLFYDWIVNGNQITGLELHLFDEPELDGFQSSLRRMSNVTFDPFPTIWLRGASRGDPIGLEGFGDIGIYRSDRGTWAVFIASIPDKITDIT